MIAAVRTKFTSPGGYELQSEDTSTVDLPDAAYSVGDIVWHEGRRLVVRQVEWSGAVRSVLVEERVQMRTGEFDAYVTQRIAERKGRAA